MPSLITFALGTIYTGIAGASGYIAFNRISRVLAIRKLYKYLRMMSGETKFDGSYYSIQPQTSGYKLLCNNHCVSHKDTIDELIDPEHREEIFYSSLFAIVNAIAMMTALGWLYVVLFV